MIAANECECSAKVSTEMAVALFVYGVEFGGSTRTQEVRRWAKMAAAQWKPCRAILLLLNMSDK